MGKFYFKAPSAMTVRVEKATSHLLITPDWPLNAQICDAINDDPWQAKHVIKAIKKRIQNKNPKVQFFALMLLEMLIKNCGDYIHFQVIERKILEEMIKIVRKGTDMQVRHKVLFLLDSWQEAFGGIDGKFPQYFWAYAELKKSGVVFPQCTLDTRPIYAPANHPELTSIQPGRFDDTMPSEMGNLSLSDLNHTRDIMELLNDMLQAVNPYDHVAMKDEVIQQLVDQCNSNQKKLLELIRLSGDEEILAQALTLNDSLQSLLTKHDAIASGKLLPSEAYESLPKPEIPVSNNPVVSNHLEDEGTDDDDQFFQLAPRSDQLMSNQSDSTTPTTSSSASEASSSVANNALVLLDPPITVGPHKEEQNMIDHLSQALTTDSSTFGTPVAPQPASTQNAFFSIYSDIPGNMLNSEPRAGNQCYSSYSNYVATWAQLALPAPEPQPTSIQSQPTQFAYSRPSAPPVSPSAIWILSPSNSFLCQASYAGYGPAGNLPGRASSPLKENNSFGSVTSSIPTNMSCYAPPPSQLNNLYGSAMNGVPNAAGVTSNQPGFAFEPLHHKISTPISSAVRHVNGNYTQKGVTTSSKPYYHPDSLFEDLVDFRSFSSGQKTYRTGMPGEPMIRAKK